MSNPFFKLAQRYYRAPCAFSQNVLSITPSAQQAELLEDIFDPEIRLITTTSGHGTGKSTALAIAAVCFAVTRYPWKVVQTAPSASQLWGALWPETARMFKNQLPAELRQLFKVTDGRIRLIGDESCFLEAATSTKESPEAMSGKHSKNLLMMADEASAIPDVVFENAQGSMSDHNATTVLTSNPTRLTGYFYKTHHELRDMWKVHRWSSEDSPFVSKDFVEQIKRTYGEDSPQYRVRVLGLFPESDDDTLISRKNVRATMEREMEYNPKAPIQWMIDPARYGSDRTGFGERRGNVITKIETRSGNDVMEVAGWVFYEWNQRAPKDRPNEILVDVIGVGGGVVDRLRELGLPVVPVNVQEAALPFSDGVRLRDSLWLEAKKWIDSGVGKLPDDPELEEELVTPMYSFQSNGKIKVESKQEMRRRGVRSPDKADTLIMSFASQAAIMAGNGVGHTRPIKMNIPMYG